MTQPISADATPQIAPTTNSATTQQSQARSSISIQTAPPTALSPHPPEPPHSAPASSPTPTQCHSPSLSPADSRYTSSPQQARYTSNSPAQQIPQSARPTHHSHIAPTAPPAPSP